MSLASVSPVLPLRVLSLSLIVLLAVACHGAPRSPDMDGGLRIARMDSATARRICQSPDSVIAGTKDCVLLDQSRRTDPPRFQPRAP
jgi:hypothetical protein